jgi:hypothetical protein
MNDEKAQGQRTLGKNGLRTDSNNAANFFAAQLHVIQREETWIMSKRSKGSYIGGGTIVRDWGWRGRVAHRVKMTKKHQEKQRQAKERFEAEMAAYKARAKYGDH